MSLAHFPTPIALSMWRLPGIRGGKSRDSSSLSMGWGRPPQTATHILLHIFHFFKFQTPKHFRVLPHAEEEYWRAKPSRDLHDVHPSTQRDRIASPGSRSHQRHPGHADPMVATSWENRKSTTCDPEVMVGVVGFLLQAQDARWDHAVEPRLWSRWHRHPGGGGEEADEREGYEPPWSGQGKVHRGSLEMEERVSEGRCWRWRRYKPLR